MATRNGKIGRLPNDIREQLNHRLLEGEPSRELAAWLNALPEVQSVLGSQFNGVPISEVNLTLWRQGGYLQWLTERECFDSARALADGDGNLAETGLSAERLLNILTLRIGQLLMRWDFSPEDGVSEVVAFSEVARKARILQGISRSLLAIHRIQSQSAREKPNVAKPVANPVATSEEIAAPSFPGKAPFRRAQGPEIVEGHAEGLVAERKEASLSREALVPRSGDKEAGQSAIRNPPSLSGEVLVVERKEASQFTRSFPGRSLLQAPLRTFPTPHSNPTLI